jgi:hypothetical protein
MMKYPTTARRQYEYTMGARIYFGTPLWDLVENNDVRNHLYGRKSRGCLEPYYYCSPHSPRQLKKYIEGVIPFPPVYQNKYEPAVQQTLALSYLTDQARWDEATTNFFESSLDARLAIYDYLFRRLVDAGQTVTAKLLSERLLESILQSEATSNYIDHIGVIQYYLSVLASSG